MTREAKVGLMMVTLLVGVFGFLLYKRLHRPPEILAGQQQQQESIRERDATGLESEGMIGNIGNGDGKKIELDPFTEKGQGRESRPLKKRTPRKIDREVEVAVEAVEKVEKFAEDVIEDVNPFAKGTQNRKKTPMPVELVSDDDEFRETRPAKFQSRKETSNEQQGLRAPDPIQDEFSSTLDRTLGDRSEPRRSEPRMEPPRAVLEDDTNPNDPFGSDSAASRVQPIQFNEPDRRGDNVPFPNDTNDRNSARSARSSPPLNESDDQFESTRRPRETEMGLESSSRERRRAAPATFLDDRPMKDSSTRTAGAIDSQSYVIQPNDNFWTISRKLYGAGRYYKALALHNQQTIPDPKMMKPGVVIATPDVSVLEQRYADSIPKAAPSDTVSPVSSSQSRRPDETESSGYFVDSNGVPMYRVGENDTLTGIAKAHLGRTNRWVQILEINSKVLRDGNELKIGMVLRLPSDASRVQVVGSSRDYR